MNLSTKLNHLVEANIGSDMHVDLENFEKFLQNKSQLNKVTLNPFPKGTKLFVEQLVQKLGEEWTVTPLDDDYIQLNLVKSHHLPEFEASTIELPNIITEKEPEESGNSINMTQADNVSAKMVRISTTTIITTLLIDHVNSLIL